jgi:hypothetical protein
MDAASVVAAIGFGGVIFMVWFLIALLREHVLSVRRPVAPAQRKPRIQHLQVLRIAYDDGACLEARSNGSDCAVELLEKQHHEKGEHGSGLTALDICIIPGKLGWSAVRPKHSFVRREREF